MGLDFDTEKTKLLSLALDLGFEDEEAHACLQQVIDLYGKGQSWISLPFVEYRFSLHVESSESLYTINMKKVQGLRNQVL